MARVSDVGYNRLWRGGLCDLHRRPVNSGGGKRESAHVVISTIDAGFLG